jgi:two-component system phosphate regulon response regulator PhoB
MDHTILVVDDEKDIADLIAHHLQKEGYQVEVAHTGTKAIELVSRRKPSLVVLDLMLPDVPGAEVCRHLRASPSLGTVPVIMLTARGTEVDRISGFETGADDYVTKPFSVRELLLRIRAQLQKTVRRSAEAEPLPAAEPVEPIRVGPIEILPASHQVLVNGQEVHFSLLEYKLLMHLLQNRGRVQTRDVLLTDVWGMSTEVTTRTIDTHVKRVREKLGPAGAMIETIRGVGYMVKPTS